MKLEDVLPLALFLTKLGIKVHIGPIVYVEDGTGLVLN